MKDTASMLHHDFTYVRGDLTGYMQVVIQYFSGQAPARMLDVPAGSGRFAQGLEAVGHTVTKADIHGEEGFVHADMEKPLPFDDGVFDAVTCLEGVEHVVNPVGLLRELVRVTAPGGTVVVSTPNTINLLSRLQFLFTGTFLQFPVNTARQTHGALIDRGHISPYTPQQLIYLFGTLDCTLIDLRVDRKKRLVLYPLYLLMKPLMWMWTRKVAKGTLPDTYPGLASAAGMLTGFKMMFGRSQILFFKKSEQKKS